MPPAATSPCAIAVPGDRMSTDLRIRLQALLAARYHAESVEYHLALAEDAAAQLFFLLHAPAEGAPEVPLDELEQDVARLARTWDDRLADELVAASGEAAGRRLARALLGAPARLLQDRDLPELALHDIALLERVAAGEPFAVGAPERAAGAHAGRRAPADPRDGRDARRQDPAGRAAARARGARADRHGGGADAARRRRRRRLPARFRRARRRRRSSTASATASGSPRPSRRSGAGDVESDTLERARDPRGPAAGDDIVILRAYRRYRRVIAPTFTAAYQNDVLCAHPGTARLLVRALPRALRRDAAARHGARTSCARNSTSADGRRQPRRGPHPARLPGADRRHGAHQRLRSGATTCRFKLRSADVPGMPAPAPLFEIFVYHPLVEGIHLRGGHVARGGIRWSDRREDYRTEVLGLMKAQMVKNAVIVPVGAKGGFVLRTPPSDRDALREEVRTRYSTLIRGMLDVTDNIVARRGRAARGRARLRRGRPLPRRRGRQGHRGALRHGQRDRARVRLLARRRVRLRRLEGLRPQGARDHRARRLGEREAPLPRARPRRRRPRRSRSSAIGDMSGDVFGNGMLLSRQIHLIAAFDHRHVFLDPTTRDGRGVVRRARSGSSRSGPARRGSTTTAQLISRRRRRLPAHREVRAALARGARGARRGGRRALDPDELVRAILRAPVDLLWNGGIGTFVKASDETHAEVGDRDTDAMRVDGRELRARVVGEGGNLGLTQRGRIEYATARRAHQHRRDRQLRRASTAPTTRSTSRSCSAPPSRRGA